MRDIFSGSKHDVIEMQCVVCGQRYQLHREIGRIPPHQCPQRVLAARLAAERKALDEEEIYRPERWTRLERRRATPQPAPALAAAGG